MKLKTRIMSGLMTGLMLLTAVACEEDTVDESVQAGDSSQGSSEDITSYKDVGEIIFLGYEDPNVIVEKNVDIFKERYGGSIKYVSVGAVEYYDKLGTMIANDQSPDLIRDLGQMFPGGMILNQFEPLQDYIDLDSPLWSGIKEYVEKFMWKGNLYFPAHAISKDLYVIHYDYDLLKKNGFEDPYELYVKGEWKFEKMREMMSKWKQLDPQNHVAYSGLNARPFVATTGKAFIEVHPDGTIKHNMNDTSINDMMLKLQDMNSPTPESKLTDGSWTGPDDAAPFKDRIRLFYGMGLNWAHTTVSAGMKDTKFRFVPYPQYENADKHYTTFGLSGYLIPKGAKNMKASLAWINLCRQEEIDPENIAKAREDAINPEPQYYTKGSKKGQEKWVLAWEPEMYDLSVDLRNPDKFGFVYDCTHGFNTELSDNIFNVILDEPIYGNGEMTWTMIKEAQTPRIEAFLKSFGT